MFFFPVVHMYVRELNLCQTESFTLKPQNKWYFGSDAHFVSASFSAGVADPFQVFFYLLSYGKHNDPAFISSS